MQCTFQNLNLHPPLKAIDISVAEGITDVLLVCSSYLKVLGLVLKTIS